jgi:4-hydroxy-tetrahydrodipicolinate synthase
MFKGSIPALVTPFTATGTVDEDSFVSHVEWQIAEGSHGLVPVGTTGESPTLSHVEHKRVVELCIKTAAGRVPVIAGAGSNNTTEAVELAQHAEKAGADAILVVTPYYNKPTQKGLFAHYAAIAESVKLPIVIYNIPGRSVVDMSVETIGGQQNAQTTNPGGQGAARHTGPVCQPRKACGAQFVQLSGEDATALGFNAHGGVGCISVTANVAPRLCAEFQEATLAGDYAKALEYQDKLMPLHKAIFMEPGLCGAKYALNTLRGMSRTVRSPLLPTLEPATEAAIDAALRHAGLMN